jgi:hypothetical protein
MDQDEAIRDLMTRLMQAVEDSLSTSATVRDALAELVKNGYEARLFFVANAESADAADSADGETAEDEPDGDELEVEVEVDAESCVVHEIGAAPDGGDLTFELTKLDKDFLKSVHLRLEGG